MEEDDKYILPDSEALRLYQTYDYNNLDMLTDSDIIIDDNTETYKKQWSKLDKYQKINRLMLYVKSLDITDLEREKQLKILLIDSVINKILIKNTDVIYDEEKMEIKNIPDLIFTDKYHIGEDITTVIIKECTNIGFNKSQFLFKKSK